MWYLKTTVVSVIVGALGMIKKETDKHVNKNTWQFQVLWYKKCSLPKESNIDMIEKNIQKRQQKY